MFVWSHNLSRKLLPKDEQATLVALAEACHFSLNAHVPVEAVTRKFPKHLRGEAKKSLEKLRRKGYCVEHPTGRNRTWQLTHTGLNVAMTIVGQTSAMRP
jgi:hypothetical protein